MNPAETKAPDAWIDAFFGRDYLRLYRDEGFLPAELTEDELQLVTQLVSPDSGPVLELACGYGRHTLPLAAMGYDIWAFDKSEEMIQGLAESLANDSGAMNTPQIFRGDMFALPFGGETFAWTLLLFNSFGYAGAEESFTGETTRADDLNIGVLSEIERVLKPGGRAIIDLPNRTPLVELVAETPVILHRTDDVEVEESFFYHNEAKVLHNQTSLRFEGEPEKQTKYYLRLYSKGEFSKMIDKAGLKLLTMFGEYDTTPYDREETSRMIAIVAKPAA